MRYAVLCVLAGLAVAAPAQAQMSKEQLRNSLSNLHQIDANKDGTLTKAELIANRAKSFARFDRDKDNHLTDADITTALALMGARGMFEDMKKRHDDNKDGKISRSEYIDRESPIFTFADTNRDNQITKVEQQAALARLK
jgi:Ca2+-binding EF-hand superfamily protein